MASKITCLKMLFSIWKDCFHIIKCKTHSGIQALSISVPIYVFGLHSNKCQNLIICCMKSFQLSLHIHMQNLATDIPIVFCSEKVKCWENTFPQHTSVPSVGLPSFYRLESTCNQLLLRSPKTLNLSAALPIVTYSGKGDQQTSAKLTVNVYRISCYRTAILALISLWGSQV